MNTSDELPYASPTLLHGHPISLIAREDLPALLAECAEEDITPIDVYVRAALNKHAMLEAFAKGMQYPEPDQFGFNWDAFEDAINDLSWLPGSGFVVIFSTHEHAAKSDAEDLHMLREILTQAHVNWAESEIPFRTYVVSHSDDSLNGRSSGHSH